MSKRPFVKAMGGGVAVTPKSLSENAGVRTIQRVLSLGTGAVSTATYLLGMMPENGGKVVRIKAAGQAAVTGTSITLNVQKVSADGATATDLLESDIDIELTASTDEEAQVGTLTTTTADLTVAGDLVLQAVVTASSVSAGPGDVIVSIEYVPSEDTGPTVTRVDELL